MPKEKTIFLCQSCGAENLKWQGQCPHCAEWNTLIEETKPIFSQHLQKTGGYSGNSASLTTLSEVALTPQPRIKTGFEEFDHVIGGGLVQGSVILIGGDPGIGKSTLLLQVLGKMTEKFSVLYVSGEESLQQIALRAKRLNIQADQLMLLVETQVENILHTLQKTSPRIAVIDSIQTIHTTLLSATPGSISQIRESAARLVQYAKQHHITLFFIGHVTKEGALAGPRVLEHMVDTVLYFEGDSQKQYRIVRAIKNRFGATNEIGLFAMSDAGLQAVSSPATLFLENCGKKAIGSVITASWEGSRPFLVEIQALATHSALAIPRRVSIGVDPNRLTMLLAILRRYAQIKTHDQDIFINVTGGLRIGETGTDLAVTVAILSSLHNQPIRKNALYFGEISLSGEIRAVTGAESRLKEAEKQGFTQAYISPQNVPKEYKGSLKIFPIPSVQALLKSLQ